jgi:hypothetical protein
MTARLQSVQWLDREVEGAAGLSGRRVTQEHRADDLLQAEAALESHPPAVVLWGMYCVAQGKIAASE